MKPFLRDPHHGRSFYAALAIFVLAYIATMALVIAPDQVKRALDAPWTERTR